MIAVMDQALYADIGGRPIGYALSNLVIAVH